MEVNCELRMAEKDEVKVRERGERGDRGRGRRERGSSGQEGTARRESNYRHEGNE